MQLVIRQVFRPQLPVQQSVPPPQASPTLPHIVSQRLFSHRRLQQSVPVRHRSPLLRQKASQRLKSPHRLPSQHGGVPSPHCEPGTVQKADERQVPAVQLFEQQSLLTRQSRASTTHRVRSTQAPE